MGNVKSIDADARIDLRSSAGMSVRHARSVRTRCKAEQEGHMPKLQDVYPRSSEEKVSADLSAPPDVEQALAAAIAKARGRAGLTQEEVAQRMQTTQSNIARLEAGRTIPSTRTLQKFAAAVGARLNITFERTDQ